MLNNWALWAWIPPAPPPPPRPGGLARLLSVLCGAPPPLRPWVCGGFSLPHLHVGGLRPEDFREQCSTGTCCRQSDIWKCYAVLCLFRFKHKFSQCSLHGGESEIFLFHPGDRLLLCSHGCCLWDRLVFGGSAFVRISCIIGSSRWRALLSFQHLCSLALRCCAFLPSCLYSLRLCQPALCSCAFGSAAEGRLSGKQSGGLEWTVGVGFGLSFQDTASLKTLNSSRSELPLLSQEKAGSRPFGLTVSFVPAESASLGLC